MLENAAIAKKHDVSLISYEGGQHLSVFGRSTNNDELVKVFIDANGSQRMGEIYAAYLDSWREAGGTLMVHHTQLGRWTRWGSWGLIQRQSQTREQSPKLNAVLNFIDTNPCWWRSCEKHPVATASGR